MGPPKKASASRLMRTAVPRMSQTKMYVESLLAIYGGPVNSEQRCYIFLLLPAV